MPLVSGSLHGSLWLARDPRPAACGLFVFRSTCAKSSSSRVLPDGLGMGWEGVKTINPFSFSITGGKKKP